MPEQNKSHVVDAGTKKSMLLMQEQNKSHVGHGGSSFSSLTLPPRTGGVSGGHSGNKVIRPIFLAVSAILRRTFLMDPSPIIALWFKRNQCGGYNIKAEKKKH